MLPLLELIHSGSQMRMYVGMSFIHTDKITPVAKNKSTKTYVLSFEDGLYYSTATYKTEQEAEDAAEELKILIEDTKLDYIEQQKDKMIKVVFNDDYNKQYEEVSATINDDSNLQRGKEDISDTDSEKNSK